MKKIILSEEAKNQIVEKFKNGTKMKDIVCEHNVNEKIIRKLCKESGFIRTKKDIAERDFGIPKEKTDLFIDLYVNSKLSTDKIGEISGCNASTVIKVLRKNNITIDQYRRGKEKLEEILELYSMGKSIREISDITKLGKSTIKNRLNSNGIDIKSKNKRIDLDTNTVHKLYVDQNKTMKEIAQEYNTSEWIVWKRIREAKIPTRDVRHPIRREIASRNMMLRIEKYGSIKVGKNEHLLINCLKEIYDDVLPQFQIYPGSHHFDAYAGGILWEFDEPLHNSKRQKELDEKYDKLATKFGYEVRRIKEVDFPLYGLEKWHNYQ